MDPGHSAKNAGGKIQLNTHVPYVCGLEWSNTVYWCMVVGCMVYTERALRWQQFHVTPATQQPNSMFKMRYKKRQSTIQDHSWQNAVSLLKSRK